ncbi:hypothetical protein D3C80_1768530 [compost metagenome]
MASLFLINRCMDCFQMEDLGSVFFGTSPAAISLMDDIVTTSLLQFDAWIGYMIQDIRQKGSYHRQYGNQHSEPDQERIIP